MQELLLVAASTGDDAAVQLPLDASRRPTLFAPAAGPPSPSPRRRRRRGAAPAAAAAAAAAERRRAAVTKLEDAGDEAGAREARKAPALTAAAAAAPARRRAWRRSRRRGRLELLLQARADPNGSAACQEAPPGRLTPFAARRPPLVCAASCGSAACVKLLLEHKADARASHALAALKVLGVVAGDPPAADKTPLGIARRCRADCVAVLEPAARSGAEGVAHALATGDMRATREWLVGRLRRERAAPSDVHLAAPFDMKASTRTASPLSIAAAHGQPQVMRLLLKAKARVDHADDEESGVARAVRGGHAEALRLLLAAGASTACRSADGRSLSDLAKLRGSSMTQGHHECLKLIAEAAAAAAGASGSGAAAAQSEEGRAGGEGDEAAGERRRLGRRCARRCRPSPSTSPRSRRRSPRSAVT